VTRVLAAGVLAMALAIVAGPGFIAFLRRNELGQHIRAEGPAGHVSKQGTPVLGGVLLLACSMLGFLLFTKRTTPALTVAGVALACAAIGFVDDYMKLRERRSLGLSGRWKMLLLALVVAGVGMVASHQGVSTRVYLPLIDVHLDLGWGYYLLVFLLVAGFANAVNLTDGLDGLAAGTATISFLTYTGMCVVAFLARNGPTPVNDPSRLDLAIMSAALVGGCVGFLWYNAYPADIFMGDTGSLALGGAVATLAVFTKTELLLVLVGGVFVLEALSVAIQVLAFRTTGRRIFLMAPIHHHFEMLEWTENKIIVRFWILAAIFGASGFVLYYLFFSKFR
jgi:phospho-N-acetylmuramoyl-pentapeptide-transferase